MDKYNALWVSSKVLNSQLVHYHFNLLEKTCYYLIRNITSHHHPHLSWQVSNWHVIQLCQQEIRVVLAILAQHYLFVKYVEYNDRYSVKTTVVTQNVQDIASQKLQTEFSYHTYITTIYAWQDDWTPKNSWLTACSAQLFRLGWEQLGGWVGWEAGPRPHPSASHPRQPASRTRPNSLN